MTTSGCLPNLVVIGAQKCGTTSLHYYLSLHPQICMSREKELDFFIDTKNWTKGIDWYKSHFNEEVKISGETSPNYTAYPRFRGVARRMRAVVPEAKLIYILRDPVERIISHYMHHVSEGWEKRAISDALQPLNETNSYILRSQYYMQMCQFLKYYSEDRIWIVTAEDLYQRRHETLKNIFRFLEVDSSYYNKNFLQIKHRSVAKGKKSRIGVLLKKLEQHNLAQTFSTDSRMLIGRVASLFFSTKIERPILEGPLRNQLIQYLIKDMNNLRKLTKMNFDEWCA